MSGRQCEGAGLGFRACRVNPLVHGISGTRAVDYSKWHWHHLATYRLCCYSYHSTVTLITLAGKTAPEVPEKYLAGAAGFSLEEELEEDESAMQQNGHGAAAAPRPAAATTGMSLNPAALLAAFMAAAQAMQIKGAMGKVKEGGSNGPQVK